MADNAADTQGPADRETAAPGADAENADLIAELDAEQGKKPAPAGKPAKKAAAKPEPKADEPAADAESEDDEAPDAEDAAADEDDDDAEDAELDEDEDEDADDDDEDDADPDADDELGGEAAADPALKKRLDAVRRTEERQRQRLEADRGAFERERTAWQTETKQTREAVDRIRGLAARAKIDPAAVLEALGLTPEDMEYAGTQCYARSKAAAAKPEYRAAAERATRDREVAEAAATNAKRIADLEAKLEGKDAQAEAERELDAYFGRAFRKASADATPITARLIARRPKAAREELAVTAARLSTKLGRLPKVAELLAAHEKREVRALKLRGIKPPGAKPAAAPETETDKPAAKASGKPAAKPGAKPAKPAADESDDVVIPSAADLVRELQRGAVAAN